MTAMPRLPDPLTPDGLRGLMHERPYWDAFHPRAPLYHRLVQREFEILYPGNVRYGARGTIDTQPLKPQYVAHLVADANREMEELERGFDERPSRTGGAVHVQSHAREGGKVEVSEYWRSRPGEGPGVESGDDSAAPKPRNLLDEADDGDKADDEPDEDRLEPDEQDRKDATDDSEADELAEHARGRDPYPDSPLDFDFRDALAKAEHSHGKPDDGYGERTPDDKALGRYQMTEDALKDAGFKDLKTGEWTEKAHDLGVASTEDFLKNPLAQEIALADSTDKKDGFLKDNGAKDYLGQTIEGIKGDFEITEAGLAAAAHREGAKGTKEYLDHLKNHDWKSDPETFPSGKDKEFRAIETRLRTFEQVPYRKGQNP
jgi:hypothetical protein